MNKLLLAVISAAVILSSCSKKDGTVDTSEPAASTSVKIGGTDYPIVKIGGKTWTTVNYNGTGGVNYDNGANDPAYGKLYTIAESRGITLPTGWRVPSKADYEDLAKNFSYKVNAINEIELLPDGCSKLKSNTGWVVVNGVNSSGFNALPAGTGYVPISPQGQFEDKGYATEMITTTDEKSVDFDNKPVVVTYYLRLYSYISSVDKKTVLNAGEITENNYTSDSRFSIRFVKDN
jgi:uncharacterized protein (TIGR02145 family)